MRSRSKHIPHILLAATGLLWTLVPAMAGTEKEQQMITALTSSVVCDRPTDFHLTDAIAPMGEKHTINIASDEAWLFFDNVKPNDVVDNYAGRLFIHGEPFHPEQNGRIAIYKQGAVIMPYPAGFEPLTTYRGKNFEGESARYTYDKYYTNRPPQHAPADMVLPLTQENCICSFRLKRGHMATFANESDGMGYSRVFIAADEDLIMTELPENLEAKISFIRVSKWQYVSKKGWAGSTWSSAPEGLKYVGEQCDLTNSTWFYNWSCTTGWTSNPNRKTPDYNHEFVPEKWGAGGEWKSAYSITDVSHLMGYNEPDHTEQSNVTVEKAIEEWPLLMQTGLRLGSPATTDYSWLYRFMREANKRNYRVDYVVIHAYWGGLSGVEWYNKIKEIHEQTGRPIWIKEWNNGANWTNESWPGGTEAQQAKQLNDLKNILAVMDTARFIERYSIYNWVEDKRALILNGKLTPAGEYYAADTPGFGYLREEQFLPAWTVREAPVLSYSSYSKEKGIELRWSDCNGEIIQSYIVERSSNGNTYTTIDTLRLPVSRYFAPIAKEAFDKLYYRIQSISIAGSMKCSNAIEVDCIKNTENISAFHELLITERWSPALFSASFEQIPTVLLGVPTYRNKLPLSHCIKEVTTDAFDFKLSSWKYQENPSLANPDTVAVLTIGEESCDWDGITAQTGSFDGVTADCWHTVVFYEPFKTIPVVLVTQVTERQSYAASARIRNVTTAGFEVKLQYEKEINPENIPEKICYLAATEGTGHYAGKEIRVGQTPVAAVGGSNSGGYTIDFGKSYTALPLFFGAMQTVNDDVTSVLRIKTRNLHSVTLIKDREKSDGYAAVLPEKVGWMIAVDPLNTTLSSPTADGKKIVFDSTDCRLYHPNGESISHLSLYDMQGHLILTATETDCVNIEHLPAGLYLIYLNKEEKGIKIVKP